MKNRISELEGFCAGRAAAVMGGGPSLPDDLAHLPAGCFFISVNGHSLELARADAIVFCDNPHRKSRLSSVLLRNRIESFKEPKISPIDEHSDYKFDVPYWDGGFSSTVATWLACFMGADPVLLCGMDCYQGEKKYFFDYKDIKIEHPCWNYPLQNHLDAWRPALEKCKNSQVIKAVSGPLVDMFGKYK